MALTDLATKISTAQVLAIGTTVSTSSINLQQARDVGDGALTFFRVTVDETLAGTVGPTITVQLVTADNEALTSNVVVHLQTTALTPTELILGSEILIPIVFPMKTVSATVPSGPVATPGQFMGLRYVGGGTTITAGKVSSSIVLGGSGLAPRLYGAQYGL